MDSAHEDAAEDNPQVGGGAEEDAHDGTEDGARAGDVQELDEINAPCGHRDVIDAVFQAVGGCLARSFDAEGALHEGTVEEKAQDEGDDGDDESNHIISNFKSDNFKFDVKFQICDFNLQLGDL